MLFQTSLKVILIVDFTSFNSISLLPQRVKCSYRRASLPLLIINVTSLYILLGHVQFILSVCLQSAILHIPRSMTFVLPIQ